MPIRSAGLRLFELSYRCCYIGGIEVFDPHCEILKSHHDCFMISFSHYYY
jgi:hypothetical protein